jgi:phosphonate transport system substrate-binding protein
MEYLAAASLALIASVLWTAPAGAEEKRTYIVARGPQNSAVSTMERWAPFVRYLAKETGENIELKVYHARPRFNLDTANGVPDFIFTNAYHYTVLRRSQGYIPLVRSDAKPLTPIVVVRQDSPVKSVEDLNGRELAFPSRLCLSYLPVEALFAEQPNADMTPRFVGNHDNVYRNVAAGNFVAGGAILRTFEREHPALRSKLRVLYKNRSGIAPHPLSAHPRVHARLRIAIVEAIMKLTATEDGRRMLHSVKLTKPVEADYERDYRPVEDFGFERYAGTLELVN